MTIYPWQQRRWQQLRQQVAQNRLPHAILITGQAGVGKYHFANSFARFLLCQQRTTDACGYCQSCHWFNAATHPDLIRIQPEEEGKAIKIAQIRQLVHDLSHTASQIGYQVVILHPAEAMNKAAANALLKIL